MDFACNRCGARWTEGAFTEGCDTCGGGAMDIACCVCGGRCGQRWWRAPLDSLDFGVAHWGGRCALPEEAQAQLRRELLEKVKAVE
jgi:hypothetical protein